jgi:TolA-binding protein
MPYAIAELIAILVMVFMLGTFVLLFPLSRRLGRVMEEWIQLRHDSSPDRERLERIEEGLRLLHGEVESLDQRMQLMGDRQDFVESLSEARRSDSLASGPDGQN